MRICILAGGERTGKSSLAHTFRKEGWEYVHFDPPKGSPYGEYRGFLDDTLKDPANRNKKYVVDRYMYCEFPYSRHFGRSTDMTYGRMNEIEDEILALDPNARVVYCENDIDVNWDLICREGKGEFRDKSEVTRLRKDYRGVFRNAHILVEIYDFTKGDTAEDVFSRIDALSRK